MRTIVIGIFLMATTVGHSQVFAHLFRQKAKQIKYLKEQIMALQVQKAQTDRANRISSDGTSKISNETGREQRLHDKNFQELKRPKAAIKNDQKVEAVYNMNVQITAQCVRSRNELEQLGSLTAEEISYVERVQKRLLEDCAALVRQTKALVTDGAVTMTDDERIERLETLFTSMNGNLAFCRNFSAYSAALARQRIREKREIENMRRNHGINGGNHGN